MPLNPTTEPTPTPTARAARIVRRTPLRWGDGGDAPGDRPAHVRAASGVAFFGPRLLVVQDDAAYIAWVDPDTGLADPVPLAAGADGRRRFEVALGNKVHKPDHEALAVLTFEEDGVLVDVALALGSGSTPARQRVALVREQGDGSHPRMARRALEVLEVAADGWYTKLRGATRFAGSELNVEGCVARGDTLVLFQRGNGAVREGVAAVNATACVDLGALIAYLAGDGPPPEPTSIAPRPLPIPTAFGDATLGFTDATLGPDGVMLYLAAAERSPNTYDDGEILGSAIGLIAAPDAPTGAPVVITHADGSVFRGKAEGIAFAADRAASMSEDNLRVFVVVDADDPGTPAELLEVELVGAWFSPRSYQRASE